MKYANREWPHPVDSLKGVFLIVGSICENERVIVLTTAAECL